MSFWLNDNRFVVYTRQIQFIHRLLLSGLLVGFIFLIWGFLFYFPIKDKIHRLTPQIKDLQNQASNYENVAKAFEKESKLNKDLLFQLKQFNEEAIDSNLFSDFLINLLSRHNISCSVVKPLFNKVNQPFLKDYFNVVFKCKYRDFCDFCNDVDLLPKPLKFCYLKIVRWKDEKIKVCAVFRNVSVVSDV